MKKFTKICQQTKKEDFSYSLLEKVRNNTKLLFSMLLFFGLLGAYAQGTLVPACNLAGPLEACAVPAGFADSSGDIIINVEVARSGAEATLTYNLSSNSSGAVIRNISAPNYVLATNKTFQTLIIYPGNTGSAFNLELNVINNQSIPATTCECSKSVSISQVSADSSFSPITCFGQLSTLVAVGNLSDQNTYTYTLNPGNITNTTGVFPNLPGSVAGILYTVTVVSAEGCVTTTSQTITQPAFNPVILSCPVDRTEPACQTQAAINSAFNTWLASFSFTGGINSISTRTPSSPNAPLACGESTEVRWDVTDECGQIQTCVRTFTVTAPPAVVFNCGTNVVIPACSSQAAVNTAWTNFLASTTVSGGCNGSLSNNAPTTPPSACGATREVIFTYTVGSCGQTQSCTRTFTVTPAPQVVFNCGTDVIVPACSTQAAVNLAWTNFLASTTASGGCGGSLTNNASTQQAPSACGGSREVTWTYTVGSCGETQSCTRTFEVTPAPQVVFNCGTNLVVPACSTQAAVNLAWTNFLASTTASGGCGGLLTNNGSGISAPSACGGSREVTWTYTVGSCGETQSCTRTFEVTPAPQVVFNCGTNVVVPACSTQAAVNLAWTNFLASTTASGGCNGSLTNNAPANPPAICGGTVDVTWTYTSSCEAPKTCTRTFAITAAPLLVANCPGNKTVVCGEDANALFAQWIAGFSYSGGCANVTVTNLAQYVIPAAGTPLTIQYSVSDGCQEKSCSSTFLVPICELPKGCSLGFWKTHPQVWDQTTDPVAAAAGFRTSTNFWTFMGIAQGTCGLPNTSINMQQAVGLNGGGCRAVTRQGVAALLGSAAFGNDYAYPLGTTNFTTLKAVIVNALSTCNCPQSLIDALNVANNNEYDVNGNNICSPLGRLVAKAAIEDKVATTNFDAYPVPFKDKITIKCQFDFETDMKIEIINILGMTLFTQTESNVYLGKEINLDLNANITKEQIYFIKVTTNRGSSMKKVISSK